jgi:hypothetical protein
VQGTSRKVHLSRSGSVWKFSKLRDRIASFIMQMCCRLQWESLEFTIIDARTMLIAFLLGFDTESCWLEVWEALWPRKARCIVWKRCC